MTLAAYRRDGFAVAGIHAFLLLRNRGSAFHRYALTIGLLVGAPRRCSSPCGDIAARHVAHHQPVKLGAMEALLTRPAPAPHSASVRGGNPVRALAARLPRPERRRARTRRRAQDEWPNVPFVHFSFQLMVALGKLPGVGRPVGRLARVAPAGFRARRRFLWAVAIATPCGFLATEAGGWSPSWAASHG